MCSRSRGPTSKRCRSSSSVNINPNRSQVLRVTGSSVEHSRMSGMSRHLRASGGALLI